VPFAAVVFIREFRVRFGKAIIRHWTEIGFCMGPPLGWRAWAAVLLGFFFLVVPISYGERLGKSVLAHRHPRMSLPRALTRFRRSMSTSTGSNRQRSQA
jgi:hypothetical protein